MEQIALDWLPLRRTYTVSELTAEMRDVLTEHFTDIWVSGEISGTKVPPSGHYYFTLKDESAQIRAVCYKMTARYLKFKPQDGIAVVARGRIDVYDARGEVQFMVDSLEPLGHGALQLAFEQLKKRLALEGLFEASRKRAIPALPERIGIVTSPAGAVIRDILQILERRAPGRHLRVFPSLVQGEGAAEQIAAGIEYFSESGWAEVVIVARGGGSLEDLWAFNEERVARAIAQCSVPVISAVGHETDFTIADFVADLRAPTPSAAAEMVIATRQSLIERLDAGDSRLIQSVRLKLALSARRLHGVEMDAGRLHRAIGRRMQRVDEIEFRLREVMRAAVEMRRRALESVSARLRQRDVRLQLAEERRRLDEARRKLDMLDQRTAQAIRLRMSRAAGMLTTLQAHLKQLSPVKILERGYAIVERKGRLVKSPADAPVGSDLRVRLAEGELGARVTRN